MTVDGSSAPQRGLAVRPRWPEFGRIVALNVHGFFWPAFVIAPWGIGVVMNAREAYGRPDLTEQAIEHETERRDVRG